MTLKEAIGIRIKQLCAENDLTVNSFANVAGMNSSTIYSIFNQKSNNPEIATIKQICDGFEMCIRDRFDSVHQLHYMEEFPSGQRGQTVNLLSLTSMVRIHPPPPYRCKQYIVYSDFLYPSFVHFAAEFLRILYVLVASTCLHTRALNTLALTCSRIYDKINKTSFPAKLLGSFCETKGGGGSGESQRMGAEGARPQG